MKASRIEEKRTHVPIQIMPMFNDAEAAIGTSFFYRHNEKDYLITNWHNVSGRRPWDCSLISPRGIIPDALAIRVPYNEVVNDISCRRWVTKSLRLYKDEDNRESIWFEHPNHGRNVDAVAIEIEGLEDTAIVHANSESLELSKLRLYPGMDAFVLGFPRGLSGGGRFPLWKRASIASEPDIDIDDLPKFLIDTATREGMSGAPVYAQETGFWAPEGCSLPDGGVFGRGERFIGIYSGRVLADDPFLAQLGVVWKEQAIIEIIEAAKRGESSFQI